MTSEVENTVDRISSERNSLEEKALPKTNKHLSTEWTNIDIHSSEFDIAASYTLNETPERIKQLLYTWSFHAGKHAKVHRSEAASLMSYHNRSTTTVVALSTIAALGGFATFPACPGVKEYTMYIILNLMTMIVSVSASLGRVYRWAERSQDHKHSALQFHKFQRKCNVALVQPPPEEELSEAMEKFRIEYDYLLQMAPFVTKEDEVEQETTRV
jgi:hypothetical protein